MSRIKPTSANHPQEMRVSSVQFLGEQDGPPERLLKNQLSEFFQRDKSVYSAYLARASLEGQESVALCVKSQFGADRGLAEKIGAIFGMIFNAHEHLDILFLTDQQESELTKVCSAFFDSRAKGVNPDN
jgi:SseB protein C-terminal domain